MSSVGGGLIDRQPCPQCGESRLKGILTPHCENKRCAWLACKVCRLVADTIRIGRKFTGTGSELP